MAVTDPPRPHALPEPESSQRLDSWKEIAVYLKRDESTVRRWEREGLPVHRHAHKKKPTVYAYKSEVDVWWKGDRTRLESGERAQPSRQRRAGWWSMGWLLVLLAVMVGLNVAGARDRLLGRSRAGEISSIAVLPLKNLSGDARQDYFADGMTEALITELGKIGALQVVSHQSVYGYRQSDKTVPEIARALKVDVVLEGTVLHSGNRVRITANLVQAVPERHLWAESYEFDPQDVLAIQSRVAREVAGRIRLKLTPQEQTRLATSRRVDPEAYEAYLLGRAYMLKARNAALGIRAEEYFKKAIEKDPAYAPAYASLAELYLMARASSKASEPEHRQEARAFAEKALELDDTLAEAHNALARIAQRDWDWAGAEREYQRAIDLNPSYPVARTWYAMYLHGMQRFEEASVQARRAQQLDPGSPYVNTWAGATYAFGGHLDEAMRSWRRALELDSTFPDAFLMIGRTYVSQGRYQEAIAVLRKATAANNDAPQPQLMGALAHALARAGQREEALKLADELERIDRQSGGGRRGYITPFALIWAYAGLGDKDHAFEWLEVAYNDRRDRIVWLNVDPLLDPLRADPRFDDLLRRVGLPVKSPPRSD
jgi:TolB-like protein/tetratricopeptide (TPR) repeat protein